MPSRHRAIAARATASIAALLFGATLSVHAQTPTLRPGLWEHSTTMKSQSGKLESAMQQMQATMASLPPEQRKMMEQMMAGQGGAGVPGKQSARLCLTQQDIERDQLPTAGPGCTQRARRNAEVWQVSFKCSGPPPSSGEGRMRVDSPTAYSGHFEMLTEIDGKPERVDMLTSGRWLGADCGSVGRAPR